MLDVLSCKDCVLSGFRSGESAYRKRGVQSYGEEQKHRDQRNLTLPGREPVKKLNEQKHIIKTVTTATTKTQTTQIS